MGFLYHLHNSLRWGNLGQLLKRPLVLNVWQWPVSRSVPPCAADTLFLTLQLSLHRGQTDTPDTRLEIQRPGFCLWMWTALTAVCLPATLSSEHSKVFYKLKVKTTNATRGMVKPCFVSQRNLQTNFIRANDEIQAKQKEFALVWTPHTYFTFLLYVYTHLSFFTNMRVQWLI